MKTLILALIVLMAGHVQAKNVDIQMKNAGKDGPMAFEPGFVAVDVGDTVTFIPSDRTHNSAAVLVPDGAEKWKGKMDQKLTVKLTKDGVYIYQCDPHSPMAMVGVIQVGKATNLEAAKTKAATVGKTFAMNKDRLTKYLGQAK